MHVSLRSFPRRQAVACKCSPRVKARYALHSLRDVGRDFLRVHSFRVVHTSLSIAATHPGGDNVHIRRMPQIGHA